MFWPPLTDPWLTMTILCTMEDFTTILIGDGAHAWFCVFLLVWAVRGCEKTRFGTFLWFTCSSEGTVGWLWNKFWKNLVSFLPSVCAVASKLSSPFQNPFLLTSLSTNHVLTCKIPNGLLGSVWQKHKQLYPCVCQVLGPCVLENGAFLEGYNYKLASIIMLR